MRKLKTLFILTLLLSMTTIVKSQRHELGLFVGGSYYIGDINPKKHFAQPNLAFGGVYRYNFTPHWAVKFNAYHGKIEGDDAVIKHYRSRNLSFRSNLTEIGATVELNFFKYMTGNKQMPASPFIFAGLSYYRFNPQALYQGEWYNLQPLGTEGQGTTAYPDRLPYSLGGISIPFGVGAKFSLGKNISLGLEWGMRKTFTDYLDDVSTTYPDLVILSAENGPIAAALSDRTIWGIGEVPTPNVGKQRGDSSNNDWYSFAGVTFTFKFGKSKEKCAGMGKSPRSHKGYHYN